MRLQSPSRIALLATLSCVLACGARAALVAPSDDGQGGASSGAAAGGAGGAPAGSSSSASVTAASVTAATTTATSTTTAATTSSSSGCVPAPEVCNGLDDDCNGVVDDPGAAGCIPFFQDQDGDGWGMGSPSCLCGPSDGFTAKSDGDCNDQDGTAYPGADEGCDGVDRNCDGVVCGCDVRTRDGHPYYFCEAPASWHDAVTFCSSFMTHIVHIGSQDEDAWVFDRANELSNERWWIGITDGGHEGTWTYEDGSPTDYLPWGPGEPNNAGNEDCGELNRFYPDPGWNDDLCDKALRFICE